MAENFSFLISYGFFGRYDLTLDTRKVLFVPYITPTLIRNIHATLLYLYVGPALDAFQLSVSKS